MPVNAGGSGFGRALETVLRERPCRVIIETDPPVHGRERPVAA
jgi:hypothetical protein